MKTNSRQAAHDDVAATACEPDFHQLWHDLRTPLNHVNGFAELMLLDESLSPTQAGYVRAILRGSAELKAVVLAHLKVAEQASSDPEREGGSEASTFLSAASGSFTTPPALQPAPTSFAGAVGQPLTLASPPNPDTKRWLARRKAELVAAVEGGLLSVGEVCERYNIAREEFVAWQRSLD